MDVMNNRECQYLSAICPSSLCYQCNETLNFTTVIIC